jgi:hypothetical protein
MSMQREVLEMRRTTGEEHPDVVRATINLAVILVGREGREKVSEPF